MKLFFKVEKRDMQEKSLWLATAPDIVFSRRRARWHVPEPIHLEVGERLRIAVAVAAPTDQGPVRYQPIIAALKDEMARTGQFEVLLEEAATRKSIDALLEKKPHIFHFIGHDRLTDENNRDTGQVALVDGFGKTDLVSVDYFSELFNRSRPGLEVATSYGDLLEIAFFRKKKRFAVVSPYALHESGNEMGHLSVQFSDKPGEPAILY